MTQKSVHVLSLNPKINKFEFNAEKLEAIFQQGDIKGRDIVAVSIVGAFRQGKSFLLNFFLRYLNEKYVKKTIGGDWLNGDDRLLNGFLWSGGLTPVTGGIHIWSELFTHDFDDGRKVAIVLIDTQGAFDNRTTIGNYTQIFALSALLSSVQIFNLMLKIQESDLQYLQLFAEYGTHAFKNGVSKPFQNLMFLVRDWNYSSEHSYGSEGGSGYLKAYFDFFANRELESTRNHIEQCFEDISCYLMPPPGEKVSKNQSFAGDLNDIDDDFKKHLNDLIPHLLAPENLIVKRINGRALKSEDFLEYFKQCFSAFSSGKIPPPENMMDANARFHNSLAEKDSECYYSETMASINCAFGEYLKNLVQIHEVTKWVAIEQNLLIGRSEMKTEYLNKLNQFIEGRYQDLLKGHNHNERVLAEVKKYYSAKMLSFDAPLEHYLQSVATENEIAKLKAWGKLHAKLFIGSPHIIAMFEAEINEYMKKQYEVVVQHFEDNDKAVNVSQKNYSAQLTTFHCEIDQYIEKLRLECEKARKIAWILMTSLKGSPHIIARFKEKVETFFVHELERLIAIHDRSVHAVEASKMFHKSKMLEIKSSPWDRVQKLKAAHKEAEKEAFLRFETEVPKTNPNLFGQFKHQLEISINEQLLELIGKYRTSVSCNPVKLAYSYLPSQ